MAHYAIGCVVLCDEERRPVGIVTDRDLACRVVARGLDPQKTAASAIATQPVLTVRSDQPLEVLIELLRESGVRRAPVVRDGRVVGLVALDDIVIQLGRELSSLANAAANAIDDSRRAARRQRRREDLEELVATVEGAAISAGRDIATQVAHGLDALRAGIEAVAGSRSSRERAEAEGDDRSAGRSAAPGDRSASV
jgi:signal-transduction protein with cAMP-binding, CBS, and nucleotidyltransferase domain